MNLHVLKTRRVVFILAALLAAAWLLPSYFSVERYRARLAAGVEQALGRPVKFGAISFHLIPRPGFTIENVVVAEDQAFGAEPFARIDRADCELGWRSLWTSRLEITHVALTRPSFNLVRNAQGDWNLETFLRRGRAAGNGPARPAASLSLDADDARIDFKFGDEKKPFALADARASVQVDSVARAVNFRVEASPVRTDLTLPTPGSVVFEGRWAPGDSPDAPLSATLRTRDALLYDWLPLITGRSSGLYGMLDAEFQLRGAARDLKVQGRAQLSQLHRWDEPPPSDTLPVTMDLRGEFDRAHGRVVIESVDGTFASSRFHLTGSIEQVPAAPALDLVLAVERSRLEDLTLLFRRCTGLEGQVNLAGRVDGLVTLQGTRAEPRVAGFVTARDVRLTTPSATFPVSDASLRIDKTGAHLLPVWVTLTPRAELMVEGSLARPAKPAPAPAAYRLTFTARSLPLHELLEFGRAVGWRLPEGFDARGAASGSLDLAGPAWPLGSPEPSGQIQVHAARLLVAGLTEPLNVPRARITLGGSQVVVDPLVAVLGTSVFHARLEHQGDRPQPWTFEVSANALALEQGALWFDVLGKRTPVPLLERLPGLSSLVERRAAASSLFGALHARGHFTSPLVTYRALALHDFRAEVELSRRVVHIRQGSFRAGGGRGQGSVDVDLTHSPPVVSGKVSLASARFQSLGPYLPAALKNLRGLYSAQSQFTTRGLTSQEMSQNLSGRATVQLKNIAWGGFDPILALATATHPLATGTGRGDAYLPSAVLNLEVHDRRVLLPETRLEMEGVALQAGGSVSFDGVLDLRVRGDLNHYARRWPLLETDPANWRVDLRVRGPLGRLVVMTSEQFSKLNP